MVMVMVMVVIVMVVMVMVIVMVKVMVMVVVMVVMVQQHSPEKSGKVGEFFRSGKSRGNFVGNRRKLAMIIHVARVLSSVVSAKLYLRSWINKLQQERELQSR